jgi:hypothetical protein
MKKKTKEGIMLYTLFFFSFFILLYGVTEYRENYYDFFVQSFQLPEEVRRRGIDREREYQRQRLGVFPVESPLHCGRVLLTHFDAWHMVRESRRPNGQMIHRSI